MFLQQPSLELLDESGITDIDRTLSASAVRDIAAPVACELPLHSPMPPRERAAPRSSEPPEVAGATAVAALAQLAKDLGALAVSTVRSMPDGWRDNLPAVGAMVFGVGCRFVWRAAPEEPTPEDGLEV